MTPTPDVAQQGAESSPAPQLPDFASFRQSENAREIARFNGKPSHEESAPSKEPSAEGDKPEGKTAPASEAGKRTQEQAKPRGNAESRLQELLADLKTAGLSPSELKTFKREAQRQEPPPVKEQPKAAEQPKGLEAPKKPKIDDFDTYQKYEEAKDAYFEQLADYKASAKLEEFQRNQAADAQRREFMTKVDDARSRYGEEADTAIDKAAQALIGDTSIPGVVKALVNDSPVLIDLLYVMGSGELDAFVALAKRDPGAAIRKAVVMEQMVQQELSKGSKAAAAEPAEAAESTRDESGRFVKNTPEKKDTKAPPIGAEVSGRGAPPPDATERAVKDGDFKRFKAEEDRREIQRRRGH